MGTGLTLEDIFWAKFSDSKDRDIFKVIEAGLQFAALEKPDELQKKRSRLVSLMNRKSFFEEIDSARRRSRAFSAKYNDVKGSAEADSQVDFRMVSADKNDVAPGKRKVSPYVIRIPASFFQRQSKLDSTKHSDAAKSVLTQYYPISKSVSSRPSESKSVSAARPKSVATRPSESKSISTLSSDTRKGTKSTPAPSTLPLEARLEASLERYAAKREAIQKAKRKIQVIDLKDIPRHNNQFKCKNQLKRRRV